MQIGLPREIYRGIFDSRGLYRWIGTDNCTTVVYNNRFKDVDVFSLKDYIAGYTSEDILGNHA